MDLDTANGPGRQMDLETANRPGDCWSLLSRLGHVQSHISQLLLGSMACPDKSLSTLSTRMGCPANWKINENNFTFEKI